MLQVITTHAMGIFLLPKSITTKLNGLLKKFWWGSHGDSVKVQWLNWDSLGVPKEIGGLGFIDSCRFNLALLSKQYWRLLKNPNSLVNQLFKQKYFPRGEL